MFQGPRQPIYLLVHLEAHLHKPSSLYNHQGTQMRGVTPGPGGHAVARQLLPTMCPVKLQTLDPRTSVPSLPTGPSYPSILARLLMPLATPESPLTMSPIMYSEWILTGNSGVSEGLPIGFFIKVTHREGVLEQGQQLVWRRQLPPTPEPVTELSLVPHSSFW